MKRMKWSAFAILLVSVSLAIALSSQSSIKHHKLEDLAYALGNEDADVRVAAVVELTEYDESAVPIIKTALQDKNVNVKKAAIKALAKIGGQKAADALAEVFSDPNRSIRTMAIVALGSTGKSGLSYLFKALETEPFPRARMFAAHGITRLAGPGDAPEILKRFERQGVATQMYLIIALVKIGDDEAYAGLSRLIESPKQLVRFYVVNAIAESPDEKALPILIDAMDDVAPEVRMWAMFGLENLNLPQTYPTVLAALQDESFYVRKEAAYTLGTLGNHDAVSHLIPFLDDPHYLVRCNAAESLGRLGDPQAISGLKRLLAEENEAVLIRTAEALVRLNDHSGMEQLIAITDSAVPLYRREAHHALRRISNDDFGVDREAWTRWWDQAKQTIETGRSESTTD